VTMEQRIKQPNEYVGADAGSRARCALPIERRVRRPLARNSNYSVLGRSIAEAILLLGRKPSSRRLAQRSRVINYR
jgi:hypothetical protein